METIPTPETLILLSVFTLAFLAIGFAWLARHFKRERELREWLQDHRIDPPYTAPRDKSQPF